MTKERRFGGERLSRVNVFRMVKRRLRDAGLAEAANCDSIRAAGITVYLAGGLRNAFIRGEHVVYGSDEDDGISWSDTGRIHECGGCLRIFFRRDFW